MLDKILTTREWLDIWPTNKLLVLDTFISYHCVLILKPKAIEWKHITFRTLDIWKSHLDYEVFVKEKWESYNVRNVVSFDKRETKENET